MHESDAMEVMYRDSNNKDSSVDSDQVQCTHSMWQKFVQSMPPSNTNSLSFMSREGETNSILHVTTQHQQYEDHLDPHLSCGDCPRLWTDLRKSVRKCPMPCQYRPKSLLLGTSTTLLEREDTDKATCVFSVSKTEDMRKWDGKSTSALAVWACELNVWKNNHNRKFFMDKCHSSFQWTSPQTEEVVLLLIL